MTSAWWTGETTENAAHESEECCRFAPTLELSEHEERQGDTRLWGDSHNLTKGDETERFEFRLLPGRRASFMSAVTSIADELHQFNSEKRMRSQFRHLLVQRYRQVSQITGHSEHHDFEIAPTLDTDQRKEVRMKAV